MRTWAEQVAALPDHPLHRLALPLLKRLHPRPIPSQSFWLLLSTVLLAAGSTLYTFLCPSRIKEFSHDQWCDQLGRSLLHYWAFAWKHRYIRLACAACYVLGGAIALWVIGTKVWQTGLFIVKPRHCRGYGGDIAAPRRQPPGGIHEPPPLTRPSISLTLAPETW